MAVLNFLYHSQAFVYVKKPCGNVGYKRAERIVGKVGLAARKLAPDFGQLLMIQTVRHLNYLIGPLPAEFFGISSYFDYLLFGFTIILIHFFASLSKYFSF